jgi:hypothetical protein
LPRKRKKPDDSTFAGRLGRCYELSGKYLLDHPDDKIVLVHGTVCDRHNPECKPNPHAWIEDVETGFVLDPVVGESYSGWAYEVLFMAVPHYKYTLKEAVSHMLKTRVWGRWEPLKEDPPTLPSPSEG